MQVKSSRIIQVKTHIPISTNANFIHRCPYSAELSFLRIQALLTFQLLLTPSTVENSTQAALSGDIYARVVRPTNRKKRQVNKITLNRSSAKVHSHSG